MNGGGTPPQMPDGEIPQMPDGEIPQMPDGEVPQLPDGETPQLPDSPSSDSQDAASGDILTPDQYHMKFRNPSGDTNFQPDPNSGFTPPDQNTADWQTGQNGSFMQRGQRQNWNAPAAEAETITVSPETWFLIGISVLCLSAGLLTAALFKH